MSQNPPANNYPYWSDAVVYVKSDSTTYKRFAVSRTDRSYITSSLSPGTYQMFVSRLGYTTAALKIVEQQIWIINFYLDN
jgi:ABC-type phosphate transport system substrate-binding protein